MLKLDLFRRPLFGSDGLIFMLKITIPQFFVDPLYLP